MLNKRGQGWELGTILLLIVGVVVVVLVILGATGAFDFIFDKTEQIPGQALETIAQGCRIAAESTLIADFCYEFKEVDNDQFINCQDTRITAILTQQDVDPITCPNEMEENAQGFCLSGEVEGSDFNEVLINGQTCFNHLNLMDSGFSVCAGNPSAEEGFILEPKQSCAGVDVTTLVGAKPENNMRCCLSRVAA